MLAKLIPQLGIVPIMQQTFVEVAPGGNGWLHEIKMTGDGPSCC